MPVTEYTVRKNVLRAGTTPARKKKTLSGLIYIALAVLLAIGFLAFLFFRDRPSVQVPVSEGGSTSLEVEFIDVGQGDSILVTSGEYTMLVDGGDVSASDAVLEALNRRNISRLDLLVVTHPHMDHIGGLPAVLEELEIDTVLIPDIPSELMPDTVCREKLWDLFNRKGCTVHTAFAGEEYTLGEATVTVLGPIFNSYEDLNEFSLVCRVECEGIRFLLTGDMESLEEKDLLLYGDDLSADVLKLGHHGSSYASSAEFLAAVNPTYCVISVGTDNDYGHPHPETLTRLSQAGLTPYRTDLLGNIRFRVSGGQLSVSCGSE